MLAQARTKPIRPSPSVAWRGMCVCMPMAEYIHSSVFTSSRAELRAGPAWVGTRVGAGPRAPRYFTLLAVPSFGPSRARESVVLLRSLADSLTRTHACLAGEQQTSSAWGHMLAFVALSAALLQSPADLQSRLNSLTSSLDEARVLAVSAYGNNEEQLQRFQETLGAYSESLERLTLETAGLANTTDAMTDRRLAHADHQSPAPPPFKFCPPAAPPTVCYCPPAAPAPPEAPPTPPEAPSPPDVPPPDVPPPDIPPPAEPPLAPPGPPNMVGLWVGAVIAGAILGPIMLLVFALYWYELHRQPASTRTQS